MFTPLKRLLRQLVTDDDGLHEITMETLTFKRLPSIDYINISVNRLFSFVFYPFLHVQEVPSSLK